MCVLIFSTTFVCNISHSKNMERDVTKNVLRSSCKVTVNLVTFFLTDFSKNTQISNLVKILPVWAELFRAGGRTDRRTDKSHEAKSQFPPILGKRLKSTVF